MPSNKLNANKITFFNILSIVLLQGITFFTSPLFSRMLGLENFGIVSVYITWVSIAAIIFGLQTGSTIGIAHNQYSGTNLKQYYKFGVHIFFSGR